MARGCSPKGVVKKHNLYNKQPKDWGQGREGEGEGRGGEGKGGKGRERRGEGRGGRGEVEGGEGRGRKERGRGGEGRKKGAGRGGGVGGRLYVSCKAELTQLPPSPRSTLTQMSDFVVIFCPLYRSTIMCALCRVSLPFWHGLFSRDLPEREIER